MRHLFFLAASCVAVSAFGGSTPDGPIWSWTPAQRVAVRLERMGPPRNGASVQSLSVGAGGGRGFIDGRTSPELFMPIELFNALLQGLADDEQLRGVNRQILAPGIRAFGFEEEAFWAKLDQETSAYRDQVRARSRAEWGKTRSEVSQQHAPTQTDLKLCQTRAATLESLRNLFRTEGFDRFLYAVVAPTITITTEGDYENPDHLLSIERGCR
jgi:hypothetical protein